MANLHNKDLHNGALVALDYQTGELVAYVGSRNYYATSTKPSFQPQYDVVGKGYRQPGSAFKPFNYAVGIDDKAITAGHDADGRRHRLRWRLHPERRRPPRARSRPRPQRAPVLAQHPGRQDDGHQRRRPRLRQGPGIRDAVQGRADRRAGPRPRRPGGPAGRPGHRLRDAGQRRQGHRPHDDPDDQGRGRRGRRRPVRPARRQAGRQPAGGLHRDRHPGRATPTRTSTRSGASSRSTAPTAAGPRRSRPAPTTTPRTSTPTATSRHRPRTAGPTGAYALAVGVWNGNSDNSLVSTPEAPLFSIDVSTYVWQGFLNEATAKWPETNFERPRRPRAGQDRPVHRPGIVRQQGDRRMVHRRRRAQGGARARQVRHRRRRGRQRRDRASTAG